MRTILAFLTLWAGSALAQLSEGPPSRYVEHSSVVPSVSNTRASKLAASMKTQVQGWSLQGSGYELSCDEVSSNCGAMILRSSNFQESQRGALVHREPAVVWRGATVELRADMRVGSVGQKASLVILALDVNGEPIAVVRSKELKGTSAYGWQSVSLKVPDEADRLVVGFELVGRGAIYVKEAAFDDAEELASR